MNKISIDWEGYPAGLDAWMKKQPAPIVIFSDKGSTMYVLGDSPRFLYHHASKYLTRMESGYLALDEELIRNDFCTPIENISVATFVKHKIKKLVRDIDSRLTIWYMKYWSAIWEIKYRLATWGEEEEIEDI